MDLEIVIESSLMSERGKQILYINAYVCMHNRSVISDCL